MFNIRPRTKVHNPDQSKSLPHSLEVNESLLLFHTSCSLPPSFFFSAHTAASLSVATMSDAHEPSAAEGVGCETGLTNSGLTSTSNTQPTPQGCARTESPVPAAKGLPFIVICNCLKKLSGQHTFSVK